MDPQLTTIELRRLLLSDITVDLKNQIRTYLNMVSKLNYVSTQSQILLGVIIANCWLNNLHMISTL